jgi:hypothetical protein
MLIPNIVSIVYSPKNDIKLDDVLEVHILDENLIEGNH